MEQEPISSEEVVARLQRIAAQTPYPVDAYLFVIHVIQAGYGNQSGEQLCWHLREVFLQTFGRNTREQLSTWSIHSTDDFGTIVYGLAEVELVDISEEDALDDFHNVYDFERAFARPSLTQWRLSTIFLITTVAAIAFAGASRLGLHGAIFTLVGAWLSIIGVFLVTFAVLQRERGRLLAIVFGAGFLVAGLWMFLSVIL